MDTYTLGQPVPLTFQCYDTDGALVAPTTAVLTVTLPSGSTVTPTLDNPSTGVYQLDYVPSATGRHVAAFVSTGIGAGAAVDVFDVVATNLSVVSLADAKAYLGQTSWSDGEITKAIAAEQSAQAKVCDIDDYGPDLREALLRRVSRNLAARAVPLTTFNTFEGGTASTRVPMRDAEVVRLEAPYRRLVVM